MTSVHFLEIGRLPKRSTARRVDEQLTDEVVENVDRFSSLVCLLRDCYDVSPLYGHWSLPEASTE